MNKRVCDVCGENEATSSYKVKRSIFCRHSVGSGPSARGIACCWGPYEKIDICEECSETILGFTARIKPPAHK